MGTFIGFSRLLLLSVLLTALSYAGSSFHVTPTAAAGGNGSPSSPWQLQVALSQPSAVHPGDTIWVHGGTYTNPHDGQDQVAWNSTLNGNSSLPIVVRAAPGEFPVLDGGNSGQNDILRVSSNYTWYWGLEIMSSDPGRVDPTASADLGSYADPGYIKRGQGINTNQDNTTIGNKFINCVVHDCFGGFAGWYHANTECYGCLFYNNGWMNTYYPRQHHGHNVYVQNSPGEVRSLYDCIMWGAFENNIQAWGTQYMDDFVFDGIVSFSYGSNVDGCNILLGNGTYNNPTIVNSMFYGRSGHPNVEVGYGGSSNAVGGNISNNYIGGGEVYFNGSFSGTTVSNNFTWYEYTNTSFPSGTGNTWTSSRPASNQVFIRKSQYEAGRANIVVYNWSGASSVTVDLSSIYSAGDTYSIVDVQNPGIAILTGKYSGPITLPMNLSTIAQPIGNSSEGRTHTPAEFNAFIATGGSILPPPTNPPAVNTSGATNVTPTGARLNGTVNPNGLSTSYHFEYGTSTGYGSSSSSANAGAGSSTVNASITLSGLTAGTFYHYRLVATNSAGTTNGSDATFTTSPALAQAPTVSTSSPSNVTTTGARLNGSVNPNGASTTYHFDYGTTTNYGQSTTATSAGSGTSSTSVNVTISGLTTGTLYHYRISATNSAGTANGNDVTFTLGSSQKPPPTVNTDGATDISMTGAQLNGSVNPNGFSTSYYFEYGPTSGYGSTTPTTVAGSGTSPLSVNASLDNLNPGTIYLYRIVATSTAGTVFGPDTSFATPFPPDKPGVPEAHTLLPNYPNPFNPGTTIEYDLYQGGEVSLKIYSSLGVEVATLVSGVQPAGRHSVAWNPVGFVSGIYFCTLKSGGLLSTRRLILLK